MKPVMVYEFFHMHFQGCLLVPMVTLTFFILVALGTSHSPGLEEGHQVVHHRTTWKLFSRCNISVFNIVIVHVLGCGLTGLPSASPPTCLSCTPAGGGETRTDLTPQ